MFTIVKANKECVVNIPTMELAEKVAGCGNNFKYIQDGYVAI
jgi:flavin reductase (DIM6/NTAB) family NADH-FMN oxidoreductase RutF